MNWYYVSSGKQAGPVGDVELAELVSKGSVLPETLVWREGMSAWTPYGQLQAPPEAAAATPVTAAPPVTSTPPEAAVCSECGKVLALDEMIRYGNRHICAACKPIFLQRLREGGSVVNPDLGFPGGQLRGVTEEELLARDYQVDVAGCLSQGWEVFKRNTGLIIVASALVYICRFAVGLSSGFIPYLGVVVSLILTGPLMAGIWLFYVKNVRNQPSALGDAFSGFGPRFWQFVLPHVIPMLFYFGIMIIVVAFTALGVTAWGPGGRAGGGPVFIASVLVGGTLAFAAGLAWIYFSVCWFFSLPLIADKGMAFWPAMRLSRQVVRKHWWMTFLLTFVCGIIGSVGVLACCLGLLVTGPVAFAALACHYEKVFGDLMPQG